MRIFAIDPGPAVSGWCILDDGRVVDSGVHPNAEVLPWVGHGQRADALAIEMIEPRGMPVGRETFDTVRWVGRFEQRWSGDKPAHLVYRSAVKLHVCGSARAKDSNIRQALIDRIGAPGTKKAPGPTYGVKSHAWAALAVAVTAEHQLQKGAA